MCAIKGAVRAVRKTINMLHILRKQKTALTTRARAACFFNLRLFTRRDGVTCELMSASHDDDMF